LRGGHFGLLFPWSEATYEGTGRARVLIKKGSGVLLKEDADRAGPPEVHDGIVGEDDDTRSARAEAGRVISSLVLRRSTGASPAAVAEAFDTATGSRAPDMAFVPQETHQTETFSLMSPK
jgi:hypothetical protein